MSKQPLLGNFVAAVGATSTPYTIHAAAAGISIIKGNLTDRIMGKFDAGVLEHDC